jgi:phage terminase large subunit
LNSKARLFVHQGGTRSGKTYAICQYLIYLLTTSNKPLVIDIIRKTLPSLKASVMRDFFFIAEQTNIYWYGVHNKAENTFIYNNHLVRFISIDQPQKIRGAKRDIAFCNEANELTLEDFRQLAFRSQRLILDFNPSDPVHWIYNEIIPRDDCDTVITTYKDNQFLSSDIINEIERMRERDPDYWRVYGEGLQAMYSKRQVYSNWEFIDYKDFPDVDYCYLGLDWGYSNDPCAIVEVRKVNDKIYAHELCYKTGMTNQDIANFIKEAGHQDTILYYDSAEPKSGEELRRLNIMAKSAIKGQGSINAGISLIKEFDIIVSNESINFKKEYQSYLWEELKDGTIVNKAQDKMNHLQDAFRYCVYSVYSKRTEFFVI